MPSKTKAATYAEHVHSLQDAARERHEELTAKLTAEAETYLAAQADHEQAAATMEEIEQSWADGADDEELVKRYDAAKTQTVRAGALMSGSEQRGQKLQRAVDAAPTDDYAAQGIAEHVRGELHESIPVLVTYGDDSELQDPPPSLAPIVVVVANKSAQHHKTGRLDGTAKFHLWAPSYWREPIRFPDVYHATDATRGPIQTSTWERSEQNGVTHHACELSMRNVRPTTPFLPQHPGAQSLRRAVVDLRDFMARGRIGEASNADWPGSGGYKSQYREVAPGQPRLDWHDVPLTNGAIPSIMDPNGGVSHIEFGEVGEPEAGDDGLYRTTATGRYWVYTPDSDPLNLKPAKLDKVRWQKLIDKSDDFLKLRGRHFDSSGTLETWKVLGVDADWKATIQWTFTYRLTD